MAEPTRKYRRYSDSELAQKRKAMGLTQHAAALRMGLKQKNTLAAVETGEKLASPRIMKGIVAVYEVSPAEALRLCVEAFEHGQSLRRHRKRQLKLMAVQSNA